MSRLAEAYASSEQLSSRDVAESRGIAQTLVAKLLTTLSQAGLVSGSRGPGGGYSLALPPQEISLLDIVAVFERQDGALVCPFGPNWCGSHEPCPLHNDYLAFTEQFNEWLSSTTLAVFTERNAPTAKKRATKKKRRAK